MNERYDLETNHSRDITGQKHWNNYITSQLNSLQ